MTFSQEFVISSWFSRFSPGCFVGFTQQRYSLSHGAPENCLQIAEKCPCHRWKFYLRSAILFLSQIQAPSPRAPIRRCSRCPTTNCYFSLPCPRCSPSTRRCGTSWTSSTRTSPPRWGKPRFLCATATCLPPCPCPGARSRGGRRSICCSPLACPTTRSTPRIALAVEPYPNRWTHHVLLTCLDDLDETVMGWVEEAYQFSMEK